MINETVDETKPEKSKTYWASKKIYRSYNSYYYGTLNKIHALNMEAFDLKLHEKAIAWIFKLDIVFKPILEVIHRLSTIRVFDKIAKKH